MVIPNSTKGDGNEESITEGANGDRPVGPQEVTEIAEALSWLIMSSSPRTSFLKQIEHWNRNQAKADLREFPHRPCSISSDQVRPSSDPTFTGAQLTRPSLK